MDDYNTRYLKGFTNGAYYGRIDRMTPAMAMRTLQSAWNLESAFYRGLCDAMLSAFGL